MRENVYAVLLVALLQLLWVAAESNGWESPGHWDRVALKVSVGFPMCCASYTAVRTTGELPARVNYPERSQWLPGFRVSWNFLALDVFAAAAAFFGFRWLLRSEAGRAASVGFVLGLVAGAMGSLSTVASLRPTSVWIVAPLMLVGLPLTVCYLTRRADSVWLPLLMLTVTLFVMPWMSGRLDHFKADRGFSFAAKYFTAWSPSLEDMVFIPLVCVVILCIPVLLMRRFVAAFRKPEESF